MIYKIEIKKILFVEADSKKEANEIAFDGNKIFSDEVIVKITKSSKKQMIHFALNPFGESERENAEED